MTDPLFVSAGDEAPFAPDIPFDPVPLRYRRDGWIPARQAAFIAALASCGCVIEACRRIGMSSESAYELARRPGAESFRQAWRVAHARGLRLRSARKLTVSAETNGTCQTRQVHQLPQAAAPPDRQLPTAAPPRRPLPAYSLEAFCRMAAARRRPLRR